jgi:amino acid transporter
VNREAGLPSVDTHQGLCPGALKTPDLVFMVMATAAPMAVVVALMPLAFAFGNGAGVPGTYLAAVVAMLLFAVGYVRIIPHVRNAGAFYAYIAASFGRTTGLAAAYVAALSYFALSCSTLGALSFFSEELCRITFGVSIRWEVWAISSTVAVAYFAYRRITLAATVLTVALVLEIALLLLLDIAIINTRGLDWSSLEYFSPSNIFAPGLGIAVIYAFDSLLGVEGTAIYQEEARDRDRTVPRATYISILAIGFFYVLTGWCLVIGIGDKNAISEVAGSDPGRFLVGQIKYFMGDVAAISLSWLVVTSAFAASLALFNNAARYAYALARDGVLPASLAQTHAKHRSPHRAVIILSSLLLVVFLVSSLSGLDPLLNISTALVGVGAVGLMALLAVTALGIPVFFARRGVWGLGVTIAPATGGCLIAVATFLAIRNYPALTGVPSGVINYLPVILLVVIAVGIVQARWLLKHNLIVFNDIGSHRVE